MDKHRYPKARKFPYRWKITLVILMFTLIPCVLFATASFKSARTKWTETTLESYYNAADNTALLLSNTLNDMHSKMNYLINNSTIQE